MTYAQARAALDHWTVRAIKPGLVRTKNCLAALGSPDSFIPIIQIAGTNGKGSVAAMLASVLTEAGYAVGRFTSPHLKDERERIVINGKMISPNHFAKMVDHILPYLKKQYQLKQPLTTFEAWTVLAMLYFKERQVAIAVVEVGMGGRLDATTALKRKVLTLLTSIDLDHTTILGDTKQQICSEKLGILKKNIPLFSAVQDRQLRIFIKKSTEQKKVPLYFTGSAKEDRYQIKAVQSTIKGTKVTFDPGGNKKTVQTTTLLGAHQALNLALVLMACDYLSTLGWLVECDQITAGLQKVAWPGRLEKIVHQPGIYLDGGHNPAAIGTVVDYFKSQNKKIILILGMMEDKDTRTCCRLIGSIAKKVWTFRPDDERGLDAQQLKEQFKQPELDVTASSSLKIALQQAVKHAGSRDCILIAGSLYNIEPARQIVKRLIQVK